VRTSLWLRLRKDNFIVVSRGRSLLPKIAIKQIGRNMLNGRGFIGLDVEVSNSRCTRSSKNYPTVVAK
jgi:hypothetical protein